MSKQTLFIISLVIGLLLLVLGYIFLYDSAASAFHWDQANSPYSRSNYGSSDDTGQHPQVQFNATAFVVFMICGGFLVLNGLIGLVLGIALGGKKKAAEPE